MANETKRESLETCWYEGSTGNHQGLVIDESTGRNVAVVYDKADAPIVAAAPELLEALKEAYETGFNLSSGAKGPNDTWRHRAEAAIAKAEGRDA